MAEKSAISWTRSTFNPWIGCTKVGPGCDHCYASVSTPARAQGIIWGPGEPRKRTSPHNWNGPLKWDKRAAEEQASGIITPGWESWGKPGFWPVFCASLADVFDNEVPQAWREDLWRLIAMTPHLDWLLVTKRVGNIKSMVPFEWSKVQFPPNIRILITVVNQEEADRDIPKLLALPCKNGISYEPALGPVDWSPFFRKDLGEFVMPAQSEADLHGQPKKLTAYIQGIQWVIVGGESDQPGMPARPFDIQWARSTVQQCHAAGVAVFVKQLGSYALSSQVEAKPDGSYCFHMSPEHPPGKVGLILQDRAGADPSEWPEDMRVQEFPA